MATARRTPGLVTAPAPVAGTGEYAEALGAAYPVPVGAAVPAAGAG